MGPAALSPSPPSGYPVPVKALMALAPLLVAPRAPSPVVMAPPALTATAFPGGVLPAVLPRGPVLPALLSAPKAAVSAVQPAMPQPAAAVEVAERPGAGVLVVDLKGSTKLYQEIGNRAARAVVDGTLTMAEEASRERGGVVARRLGDGLLIVFPDRSSAQAAERSIQARMPDVRAGLGRPELALHSAVDSGRVVEDLSGGRYDAYGQAVERALRDAAAAESAPPAPEPAGQGWRQAELQTLRFEKRATLFADLEDWPRNYDDFGRRRAVATVKAFHAYAAAVTARHGGTLVKTSGEGVMVSFGDPLSAVKAGAELQARLGELKDAAPLGGRVKARVGVSYGRALREDKLGSVDYYGNTVNAAARLMKLAGGGGILISAAVLHDPAAKAYFKDGWYTTEAHALKGFDRPLETLRLDPALLTPPPVRRITTALRRIAEAVMNSLPARP